MGDRFPPQRTTVLNADAPNCYNFAQFCWNTV